MDYKEKNDIVNRKTIYYGVPAIHAGAKRLGNSQAVFNLSKITFGYSKHSYKPEALSRKLLAYRFQLTA